jgi:predicted secreted Zn-dependent protease
VRVLSVFALLLYLSPLAQSQTYAHGGGSGALNSNVQTVYYEVEGGSLEDLLTSLRRRGPVNEGETFFGLTQWSINTQYAWVEHDGSCSIQNPVVNVDVTITMPRWDAPPGVPYELVQAWNRFKGALASHENTHSRLALEAAEAVRWELATLRYANCVNADLRARQRVAAIIDDYNRRNQVYDRETRHGYTEGAVWPPRQRVGGPPR